jgi:tRNA 2-selenouridine synthase
MSQSPVERDFRQIFLHDIPLLDVRAEIEYARGSFPSASNMPILNTDERARVGTTYKQCGQEAAIGLGHALVQGQVKADRVAAWCKFARNNAQAQVFCWRGGMRSNLAAQWMAEAGCPLPVIPGGYKALRGYLMHTTIAAAKSVPLVVIGGRTGVAKTPLVRELATGIDLEHHAHHRGSSFGRHATDPPSQVDFEHRLAIDLLKVVAASPDTPLFVEDESFRVGAVSVPAEFFTAMRAAPLVIVEMPLDFRIERIYQEYVVDLRAQYLEQGRENAEQLFESHLLDSLGRIRKRLGMARFVELRDAMQRALNSGEETDHHAWISALLTDYYDPMYTYQLSKSTERVVFAGDYAAVLEWCREHGQAR